MSTPSDKRERALKLGQAIQGKAIAFPVRLVTDDENDPGIEWFVDANGEHVDPYTIMLALNAFAPRNPDTPFPWAPGDLPLQLAPSAKRRSKPPTLMDGEPYNEIDAFVQAMAREHGPEAGEAARDFVDAHLARSATGDTERDAARYRFIRENDDFLYRLLEELQRMNYHELALWQRDLDESIDDEIGHRAVATAPKCVNHD
jgi:hypothetical protein